jgi:hypothetical protein
LQYLHVQFLQTSMQILQNYFRFLQRLHEKDLLLKFLRRKLQAMNFDPKNIAPRALFSRATSDDIPYIIILQGVFTILEYSLFYGKGSGFSDYGIKVSCSDDTYAGSLGADLSDRRVIARRSADLENDISVMEKLSHGVIDPDDKGYLPAMILDRDARASVSEVDTDADGKAMNYRKDNPVNVADETRGKSRGDIKITGLSGVSPQPAISRKLKNLGTWKHSADKQVTQDKVARLHYRNNQKDLNRVRISRCICGSLQVTNHEVVHNHSKGIRVYYCRTCDNTYLAVMDMPEVRACANGTVGVIHPKYQDVFLVSGQVGKIALEKDTLTVEGYEFSLKELMK